VRIVVLGYLIRGPMGGLAWHYLQYLSGLAALGHDVYYLEDAPDDVECLDPRSFTTSDDPSYGLAFTAAAFQRLDLGDRWGYRDVRNGQWTGPLAGRIDEIRRTAEIVLNVSAVNAIDALADVPVRVFIDTDPAFTQIQHLTEPSRRAFALRHNAFFTFGEEIPAGRSTVPSDGLPWQPTRQPVDLDVWPVVPGPERGCFTTVMIWNSYAPVAYGGRRFGMKSDSFAPYLDLPRRVTPCLEIAAHQRNAPPSLAGHGWRLSDPGVTIDPWAFRDYIRSSRAEFSVAKHGYVAGRTGWFSERSANYMASGRPVILEDTGFSSWLRADAGVVPFTNPDGALEAIERVNADYARHSRAAREIAAEYFDARRVLSHLIERAMAAAG
jgi:hypothetical protein